MVPRDVTSQANESTAGLKGEAIPIGRFLDDAGSRHRPIASMGERGCGIAAGRMVVSAIPKAVGRAGKHGHVVLAKNKDGQPVTELAGVDPILSHADR